MDSVPLMSMLDVENGEEATIKDDFCYRNNVAQAHIQIRLGNFFIYINVMLSGRN